MNNLNNVISQLFYNRQFLVIFLFWNIFWKGIGLWKASQKKQLVWFILLLIVNTLGLLEIAYIFFLNRWSIDNGRLLAFFSKKNITKKK